MMAFVNIVASPVGVEYQMYKRRFTCQITILVSGVCDAIHYRGVEKYGTDRYDVNPAVICTCSAPSHAPCPPSSKADEKSSSNARIRAAISRSAQVCNTWLTRLASRPVAAQVSAHQEP
jgi:hypothetical protein